MTTDFFPSAVIAHFALSPDGKWLAFTGGTRDRAPIDYAFLDWIVLADADTGKQVCRIRRDDKQRPGQVLFSPDSRYLFVGGHLHPACLFDLDKKKFIRTYEGSDRMGVARFSPDNKFLIAFDYSKSRNGNLTCWDARTGKRLYQAEENMFGTVDSLTFSDDSRYLATAHHTTLNPGRVKAERGRYKNAVQLWQVADGKHLGALGSGIEWVELAPPHDCAVQQQAGVQASGFRVRNVAQDTYVALPAISPSAAAKAGCDPLRNPSQAELTAWQKEGHRTSPPLWIQCTPDGATLVAMEYPEQPPLTPVILLLRRASASVKEPRPTDAQFEKWFEQLASDDASRAHQVAIRLARFPNETLRLFEKRVGPAPAHDPDAIARLIARLNDDDFAEREQAERDVLARGDEALPALRKALDDKPSAEARTRIRRVVRAWTPGGGPPAPVVQRLWAIEILEHLGTADARAQLKRLAAGEPRSCLTQEAKLSLERLEKENPRDP
jgi:hypothetical protein